MAFTVPLISLLGAGAGGGSRGRGGAFAGLGALETDWSSSSPPRTREAAAEAGSLAATEQAQVIPPQLPVSPEGRYFKWEKDLQAHHD